MTGSIRVGVGGWTYKPWRGTFYPQGLLRRRELEFASRCLTSIEINATYYSRFASANWIRWREETPEDFVFSIKASRYCTNRRDLASAGDSIAGFAEQGFAELSQRLGPINWQFAATKKFDATEMEAFLKLLPRKLGILRLRHALEVRYESFRCPAFCRLARRHNAAIVFADSDEFPAIDEATADFTYARLMRTKEEIITGYCPQDLVRWAKQAKEWAKRGDVFIYFIAGAKNRAPAAAQALIGRLGPGVKRQ